MENDCIRPKWLEWAKEIQFIAQAGIEYSPDPFDRERFERLCEMAAEMLAAMTELPLEKVRDLFCNETGFSATAAYRQADRGAGGHVLCCLRRRPLGAGGGLNHACQRLNGLRAMGASSVMMQVQKTFMTLTLHATTVMKKRKPPHSGPFSESDNSRCASTKMIPEIIGINRQTYT